MENNNINIFKTELISALDPCKKLIDEVRKVPELNNVDRVVVDYIEENIKKYELMLKNDNELTEEKLNSIKTTINSYAVSLKKLKSKHKVYAEEDIIYSDEEHRRADKKEIAIVPGEKPKNIVENGIVENQETGETIINGVVYKPVQTGTIPKSLVNSNENNQETVKNDPEDVSSSSKLYQFKIKMMELARKYGKGAVAVVLTATIIAIGAKSCNKKKNGITVTSPGTTTSSYDDLATTLTDEELTTVEQIVETTLSNKETSKVYDTTYTTAYNATYKTNSNTSNTKSNTTEATTSKKDTKTILNYDLSSDASLKEYASYLRSNYSTLKNINEDDIVDAIKLANLNKLSSTPFTSRDEVVAATVTLGKIINVVGSDDVMRKASTDNIYLTESQLNDIIKVQTSKLTVANFKDAKTAKGYDIIDVFEICTNNVRNKNSNAFEYAKVANEVVTDFIIGCTVCNEAPINAYYAMAATYNANATSITSYTSNHGYGPRYGQGEQTDGYYGYMCSEAIKNTVCVKKQVYKDSEGNVLDYNGDETKYNIDKSAVYEIDNTDYFLYQEEILKDFGVISNTKANTK